MAIENAQLTTTQLDLLTVPDGKSYAITTVMVCNQSTSASATFDMHLCKDGQAVSNIETLIVKELDLPQKETFTFDSEKIILEAGEKLSFVAEPDIGAGATNLVATVSYLEV